MKLPKRSSPALVCWAVLLALPLVVCFGRSAAQIRQIGPPLLFQNSSVSVPGGPFWALNSPNPPKTDLASLVCLAVLLALPLVVRFVRSTAQILQNGPRQLGLLGCAPCSLRFGRSAAQILQNGPRKLGLLGCAQILQSGPRQLGLLGCGPVLAAQQPKSSNTDFVSFVCLAVLRALPLVVRFWPLSSPNPPKRTSSLVRLAVLLALPLVVRFWPLSCPNPPTRTLPPWSAWLASSGGPFWPLSPNPVLGRSAQILQNGPRQLGLLGWAPCSALVVRFGRSAAQNGPQQLGLLGCAPCSPSGSPFWPLSSPNPPKRTSRLVRLAVLLALPLVVRFGRSAPPTRTWPPWSAWLPPLVVRFGRSAAQILQNGPRQLGLLGWAPCSALVVRFGRSAAQNGPRQLGLLGCAPLLSLW